MGERASTLATNSWPCSTESSPGASEGTGPAPGRQTSGPSCSPKTAPLATELPDENLVDWHARHLVGDLVGARVLDVGCGNGRNSRWPAGQGAIVVGVDTSAPLLNLVRTRMPSRVTLITGDVLRGPLPAGPFDVVNDSGCFHHIAPHRRATYLERVLPLVAPGGSLGIVTLAAEAGEVVGDAEMLLSGDNRGGTSSGLDDLREVVSALELVEGRRLRHGVEGVFGLETPNAALFRSAAG